MRVIRREFFDCSRSDVFHIIPVGDIHIGAAACDEILLKRVIGRIKDDPSAYWIGMGDMAEWINVSDKRFNPAVLADWIEITDLVDLAKAQEDRLIDLLSPIAHKCLALVEGNHEITLKKHTERDIFSNIVTRLKGAAGFPNDHQLGVGIYGWLQLCFYRAKEGRRSQALIKNINLHHGFVGGKLAGAKALNMQRWLWSHDCDLALFGHSHNTSFQVEGVEEVDRAGKVTIVNRVGAFTGTFLRSSVDGATTYSEEKGYFPLPIGGVEIEIHIGANRLRVSCDV